LQDEDGTSRIRRSRRKINILAWTAVLNSILCNHALAVETLPKRNTDIKVESSDFDGALLDQKLSSPKEKFGVVVDESTDIGINEDGDPNLSMRF
jgi:hypothetical protein